MSIEQIRARSAEEDDSCGEVCSVEAEHVNHPSHYGGDTVYETSKVIHAWGLGFDLGNAIKYINRTGRKGDAVEDLKKARFYIDHAIQAAEVSK